MKGNARRCRSTRRKTVGERKNFCAEAIGKEEKKESQGGRENDHLLRSGRQKKMGRRFSGKNQKKEPTQKI